MIPMRTGKLSSGLFGCKAASGYAGKPKLSTYFNPTKVDDLQARRTTSTATPLDYGIKRYQTETRRLYQVLEDRLAEQAKTACKEGPWVVGDRMTIADMANFAWVNWTEWAESMSQWLDRINERPAVKRGLDVPEPFMMKQKLKSKEGEEEYAKRHSQWVMNGQEADQKKHG
ncbi:MAG: hypothetical protein L6R42_005473 [Xanthoria sp. 1 TBL-2021]|nr:MAG: hypothetical protein L6R42_005473 [Xanthoria sp. 1 TBL-2021]